MRDGFVFYSYFVSRELLLCSHLGQQERIPFSGLPSWHSGSSPPVYPLFFTQPYVVGGNLPDDSFEEDNYARFGHRSLLDQFL